MKKFLPLILFLCLFANSKAQFVDIPDANFRTFLKSKYPTCFNASDQLDTVCAATAIDSNINCSNKNISSLEGIQYFKRLAYLNCDKNNLTSIPPLSNVLISLSCAENQLTEISSFTTNKLTSLICSHNQLTNLPSLAGVRNSTGGVNGVAGFEYFNCSYNLLTELPPMPIGAYLVSMSFDHNNITCLPSVMPRVHYFSMDSTIRCISDDAYYNIAWASIYGSNSGSFMIGWGASNTMPCYDCPSGPPSYPICNPTNNVNGCVSTTTKVEGSVFYDDNLNGIKDADEIAASNIKVALKKAGNNVYTYNDGGYSIKFGKYLADTIIVSPPNYFVSEPSTIPIPYTVNDTLIKQDFALQVIQNIDSIDISITSFQRARPGFGLPYFVSYKNVGTTILTSNIAVQYDATKLQYDSSSNHSVTSGVGSLNLASVTLRPGETKSFMAYFRVKPSVVINDTIRTYASISDGAVSDTDSSKLAVTGSYDPNDKQATPILTPQEVINGEYINYTIRFQNTGNDTAFNIVVADTLNSKLQTSTFELINTSHNCNVSLVGNVLYFEFLNILLPDSNVNEPASHGFITFRIRALKNVQLNDVIPNKAYIYFDYNAPIITNTATTTIYIAPPQPVGLLNFTAGSLFDGRLQLNWSITNELNCKNYEIQESMDGNNFVSVGTVNAQNLGEYDLIVAAPVAAIMYYRLKINDIDGKSSYSNIVKIQQQKNNIGLMVMNPGRNNLTLNVTDKDLINTEALFVNSNGQLIKKIILKQGLQHTDINNVSKGIYYLQTKQGNKKVIVL
ncbi:DUF7619 domain-containing protein [Ferruginibacter sp. SUN002]|uniref:DUF7619 domain-containing protein n=1 Tax=Ferruginibacter sp. SUN002 TaxID=2937789 RepID=UPI003D36E2A8